MKNTRWKSRPPDSNWGDFGPDDQRGRMNWVTREKVLQGVAEVKEGLTFVLSLPLDYPGGNGLNPRPDAWCGLTQHGCSRTPTIPHINSFNRSTNR